MARPLDGGSGVRTVCQVGVVGLAVVWSTQLTDPMQLPKATFGVVLAFAALAMIVVRAVRGYAITLPPRPFSIVVGVFVLASLLAVATADSMGRALVGTYGRWSGLAVYSASAALALVTAAYFPLRDAARLLRALAAATGLVAVYGMVQRLGLDPLPWVSAYGDKVFSSLGNPNFAAAFLGLGVPVWIWIAVEARSARTRVAAAAVVVLHLVVQVWTESLQGPAVTLAGVWVYGYVMAGRAARRTALRIRAGLVGGATAALLLAIAGYLGRGPLAILDWTTVGVRRLYWRAGVEMFADQPLLGFGFTGYGSRYRQYRSVEAWDLVGTFSSNDAAHSVPLDMFVSGGLLLGVAYLAVLALVTWFLIRAVAEVEKAELPIVAAVAGAWMGYVTQLFISIDVPPLALVGWMLGGLAVATRPTKAESVALRRHSKYVRNPTKLELVGAVTLVAVVGLGSWAMVRQARADWLDSDSQALAETEPAAALPMIERAGELAPWNPRYIRERAHLLYSLGEPGAALDSYEAAAVLDPYWWDAHVSAARLSRDLGDSARAVGWYERAIEIDPIAPEIKFELAEIEVLRGDPQHSVELLSQALELTPGQTDWWLLFAEALEAAGQLDRADEARCTALGLNPALENVACEAEG